MRNFLIVLFALLPSFLFSQSISVSHSVRAFGKTSETVGFSIKYKAFGLHYYYNYTPEKTYFPNGAVWTNYQSTSPAISFIPINEKYFSFGGILSKNHFPVKSASRLNFIVSFKIPIKRVSVFYTHISSGFGLLHKPNPGMDSFGLEISL